MSRVVVIPIEPHVVSESWAQWCHACQLPSAVEVVVVYVNPFTMHTYGRETWQVCADCGARSQS